jgi:hypothetical protein
VPLAIDALLDGVRGKVRSLEVVTRVSDAPSDSRLSKRDNPELYGSGLGCRANCAIDGPSDGVKGKVPISLHDRGVLGRYNTVPPSACSQVGLGGLIDSSVGRPVR